MSKNYFLIKSERNTIGTNTRYKMYGYEKQNYPLYNSHLRHAPPGQVFTSNMSSPVRYNVVRRVPTITPTYVRLPTNNFRTTTPRYFYPRMQYGRIQLNSPFWQRRYHIYKPRTATVGSMKYPGPGSPDQKRSDINLVGRNVDVASGLLRGGPLYTKPANANKDTLVDIKISYSTKYSFYITVPHRLVKNILDELFADSLSSTGETLNNIDIRIGNHFQANLYTTHDQIIKAVESICKNCSPKPQFKDSSGNDIESDELVRQICAKTGAKTSSSSSTGSSAGVVVLVKNGDDYDVVLVKEKGKYGAPGGGVNSGESTKAAAARELQEESKVLVVQESELNNAPSVTVGTHTAYFIVTDRSLDNLEKVYSEMTDDMIKALYNPTNISHYNETDGITKISLKEITKEVKDDKKSVDGKELSDRFIGVMKAFNLDVNKIPTVTVKMFNKTV